MRQYCGEHSNLEYRSPADKMAVEFLTDHSRGRQGFKLQYKEGYSFFIVNNKIVVLLVGLFGSFIHLFVCG